MGLTTELAERVAAFPAKGIPAEVQATVLCGFADCVGVMVAGWSEEAVQVALRHVGIEAGRALDMPAELDSRAAALVYGTAAHVLDFDDTGLTAHPSAVLVPALLAEAPHLQPSGAALITAYIAGYETWAELWTREPGQHHAVGWHPTAVFGTVASAAAIARLRGLDAATIRNAIAISASMASGLVANFGSMTKSLQVGRAIANGIEAVRLAQAGLTASADALEHDLGLLRAISPNRDARRDAAMPEFGRHILRYGLNIKLYPVCYAAHRSVDAMLRVRAMDGFDAAAIARIDVEIGAMQAAMLRHHHPRTPLDAKFSLEFAMASAALFGRLGLAELEQEVVDRADVAAFYPLVHATPLVETNPEEPAHSPHDRVVVTLRDGRRLDSGPIAYPEGHFRNPVGIARLREKFIACTASLAEGDADRVFAGLQSLPQQAHVGTLRDLLGLSAKGDRAA